MDAFDADVLIYASAPSDARGRRVRSLFENARGDLLAGVGSTLLVPEVLIKPVRTSNPDATNDLTTLLARLDLLPVDDAIARYATLLGAKYGLRAADSVHLATAALVGADRFITNNRKDFPKSIEEVDVTYPDDL